MTGRAQQGEVGVRLIIWNILHGGGPNRMPEIALAIVAHEPDVVVLTEFRRSVGGQIVGVLADRGLVHAASTRPGPGENGVLIASRWPLEVTSPTPSGREFRGRWLGVRIAELGFGVLGVHVPDDTRLSAKCLFWRELVTFAKTHSPQPWLVAGDFNTGRHHLDEEGATFGATALLGEFCTAGFEDAWRRFNPTTREFSWVSRIGNGFRIDHAFASGSLAGRLSGAKYSHSERENRLSDHSVLLVDLA